MKYVKPMVEVINIENEDIIVASGCNVGTTGSAYCGGSTGRVGAPNVMSAMPNCNATSGYYSYDSACVFGTTLGLGGGMCRNRTNGVLCDASSGSSICGAGVTGNTTDCTISFGFTIG